jgi:UDP-N-acetylmuramoyl-tripeptide--D-alanyl-D-alanine ligase
LSLRADWAADELRAAGLLVHVAPAGGAARTWRGAAIDSREDCKDRVFVALSGKRDGHEFVGAAVEAGATGLLVARPEAEAESLAGRHGVPTLAVTDTAGALQRLGRSRLAEVNPRRVAVTGSNGKTTTKDYVRCVLATRYRTTGTVGNRNNHLGVPLTLLDLEGNEEWIALELGASAPGEIDLLGSWVEPEIGVITNIGAGHLEFFGSLAEIAHAKGELLDRISPEGLAVLPADDSFFEPLRNRSPAPVLTFGFGPGADVRVQKADTSSEGTPCVIDGTPLVLRKWGRHNALNAAAALAVADHLGIPREEAVRALEAESGTSGRSRVLVVGGVTVVDDTYNANPSSMREALSGLAEMKATGKRWAVLGDMLELGAEAAALHREAGALAARLGLDHLVALGELAGSYCKGAREVDPDRPACSRPDDATAAARQLAREAAPGDVVLVKGSRGMAMERVIAELTARTEGGEEKACSTI